MRRLAFWLLLPLTLVAGCATQQPTPSVNPQAKHLLTADVRAVHAAADQHNRPAAESALQRLTTDVATAQAQGQVTPAYARTVLAAADRVTQDVRNLPPPAPVVVTVPTPPSRQNGGQDHGEHHHKNGGQQNSEN